MGKLLRIFFNFILILTISSCQLNQSINEMMIKFEDLKIGSDNNIKQNTDNQKDVKFFKNQSSISEEKKNEFIILENIEKKPPKEVALVQPRIKLDKFEDFSNKSHIGLLLPLTGSDSKIGRFIVDFIRIKISKYNMEYNFKIYDTKSTKQGLIGAFKDGHSEGVKHYIGPVFSNEALALKDFTKSKDVKIFSFSNDKNAASNNIIISGFSVEDELKCIFRNMDFEEDIKIGIIVSKNRYGNLIKETSTKFLSAFSNIKLDFLELFDSDDIDIKIKEFSSYNFRKKLLENEITRVENEELENKDIILEKLSKLDTFGEPPYDYLLVAENGNRLIEILSLFSFYDINSSNTKIFGTSIWEGLEKFNEDVLDNTFFVTSLKQKSQKSESDIYSNVSQTELSSLGFLADDLVDIVGQIVYNGKNIAEFKEKPFIGNYSNVLLTKGGLFKREIFMKKYKSGRSNKISRCLL